MLELSDKTVEEYGRDFVNLQKNRAWKLIRDLYENKSTVEVISVLSDPDKKQEEKNEFIRSYCAIYKLFNLVDNIIQNYDQWLERHKLSSEEEE